MGSWIDNLKKMRKPEHITIEPANGHLLRVTLQYFSKKKGIYTRVIYINENVSIDLKELNALVSKGERWGDWGGPVKCGDIIHIEGNKT